MDTMSFLVAATKKNKKTNQRSFSILSCYDKDTLRELISDPETAEYYCDLDNEYMVIETYKKSITPLLLHSEWFKYDGEKYVKATKPEDLKTIVFFTFY